MKNNPGKKKAVVLLSGGLDSATVLYHALQKNYACHCLVFDYGQRHHKEIRQAKKIAQQARCPILVLKLVLPSTMSSLTNMAKQIPVHRKMREKSIPNTYVPARNIVFLSLAASYAETVGAHAIFIGANAIDYSGYPDCRPEFLKSFERALTQGMKTGVEGKAIRIHAPFVRKTKAQIIRLGMQWGVPYHLTWSCYLGGKTPCGQCDSCRLRAKGFVEAGMKDPLEKTK